MLYDFTQRDVRWDELQATISHAEISRRHLLAAELRFQNLHNRVVNLQLRISGIEKCLAGLTKRSRSRRRSWLGVAKDVERPTST
jgi:hypothetical protein